MSASSLQLFHFSHDESIIYTILPFNRVQEALQALTESFYPYEPISIGSHVAKNAKAIAELNRMVKNCIEDNVSVVAIEKASNKLVGLSINKIQKKPINDGKSFFEKFRDENCREKEAISLMNVMISCDAEVDLFQHYNTDTLLELTFLTVLPKWRKKGIGIELIKTDLLLLDKLAESSGKKAAAVTLFTSAFSQKIGDLLNFDVLAKCSYDKFEFNGIKFSNEIGGLHKEIKVYGKCCKNL